MTPPARRAPAATRGAPRPTQWPLHLTQRTLRFETSTLALLYAGLWLFALAYVLVLLCR